MPDPNCPYVSRGGLKLAAALDAFGINPGGMTCADLGCSVGGFTDCLLQSSAAKVYAIDTAYGELAWALRQDERVVVMERTNALHAELPESFPGCDLVTIDLGWTRQQHAVPAALRWLRDDADCRIITLIKPHYEAQENALQPGSGLAMRNHGVLDEATSDAVATRILAELLDLGVEVLDHFRSPITGAKGGNVEHLALLRRVQSRQESGSGVRSQRSVTEQEKD